MTITDTATASTDTAVRIEVKGNVLARALGNALAHVGKDETIPVLCAVSFRRHDYAVDRWTVASTDRYTLQVSAIDDDYALDVERLASDIPSDTFNVRTDDAKRMAAMAKASKAMPVTVTFNEGRVELRTFEGSATFTLLDGDFPRIHALFPTAEPALDGGIIGLQPIHLAKFTAMRVDDRPAKQQPALVLTFRGAEKPVVVTPVWKDRDGNMPWFAMVMPYRLGT